MHTESFTFLVQTPFIRYLYVYSASIYNQTFPSPPVLFTRNNYRNMELVQNHKALCSRRGGGKSLSVRWGCMPNSECTSNILSRDSENISRIQYLETGCFSKVWSHDPTSAFGSGHAMNSCACAAAPYRDTCHLFLSLNPRLQYTNNEVCINKPKIKSEIKHSMGLVYKTIKSPQNSPLVREIARFLDFYFKIVPLNRDQQPFNALLAFCLFRTSRNRMKWEENQFVSLRTTTAGCFVSQSQNYCPLGPWQV